MEMTQCHKSHDVISVWEKDASYLTRKRRFADWRNEYMELTVPALSRKNLLTFLSEKLSRYPYLTLFFDLPYLVMPCFFCCGFAPSSLQILGFKRPYVIAWTLEKEWAAKILWRRVKTQTNVSRHRDYRRRLPKSALKYTVAPYFRVTCNSRNAIQPR